MEETRVWKGERTRAPRPCLIFQSIYFATRWRLTAFFIRSYVVYDAFRPRRRTSTLPVYVVCLKRSWKRIKAYSAWAVGVAGAVVAIKADERRKGSVVFSDVVAKGLWLRLGLIALHDRRTCGGVSLLCRCRESRVWQHLFRAVWKRRFWFWFKNKLHWRNWCYYICFSPDFLCTALVALSIGFADCFWGCFERLIYRYPPKNLLYNYHSFNYQGLILLSSRHGEA